MTATHAIFVDSKRDVLMLDQVGNITWQSTEGQLTPPFDVFHYDEDAKEITSGGMLDFTECCPDCEHHEKRAN